MTIYRIQIHQKQQNFNFLNDSKIVSIKRDESF